MKAYVLVEKGHAEWMDVPEPVMEPEDVIIRPTAVATCTTDIHLIKTAGFPMAVGKAIGHEGVGIVEKVGSLVSDFKPGDRVIIPSAGSDWRHPRAQRGEAKFFQSNNAYFSPDPNVAGLFSELVRAQYADQRVAHIPDGVTDIQAVMIPDMVTTGFTGIEDMQVQMGDTILILGSGPVGLMGIVGARLKGAGRIIAVGHREKTRKLAAQYGATDWVDYHDGDILQQVMALTGGQPVDDVLIASGGDPNEIFTTAMNACKAGGHIVCVSIFFDYDTVTLPFSAWGYGAQEKYVSCCICNDGRDWFERLASLVEYGRFDPSPLVTHVLKGWDKLEEGMELMRSRDPEVIKPVIIPELP